MVKVINPLFSHGASGRIGGIVYQTGTYGAYIRTYVPQRYKPSEAQLQQNNFFGAAADSWRLISDEEKEEWNKKAAPFRISGYNLFIKKTIQHPE